MSAEAFFSNLPAIRRGGFIALNRWGLQHVRQLVQQGRLRHGDLSVLLALAQLANRRTGLLPASTTLLASLDGMPGRTTVGYALRRLESADLVRRVSPARQSSSALLLLSPAVFSGVREDFAQQHYRAWLREQDAVPPPPVTAGAVAAGHAIAPAA